jgi:multiple sugar transport system ATP-binding protein
VYFQVQSEGLQSDQLEELAADAGAHEVPSSGEGQVVARVDAASRIKRGEDVELWLDTDKLHFFDPSTGESLTAK